MADGKLTTPQLRQGVFPVPSLLIPQLLVRAIPHQDFDPLLKFIFGTFLFRIRAPPITQTFRPAPPLLYPAAAWFFLFGLQVHDAVYFFT